MSDSEIRQVLIERKKQEKREDIRAFAEGFFGFGGLFFIIFMMSVIGG
jgi:hypothetical protein